MRGLSFMPAMLRAYREGRKFVTRRLVKRPAGFTDAVWNAAVPHNEGDGGYGVFGSAPYLRVDADETTGRVGERIRCPQGVVGDRLWVKEALVPTANGFVSYASDGEILVGPFGPIGWGWKPSKLAAMYCPRWASRDTVEIVSVRVERLQEISEEDAEAEGVDPGYCDADDADRYESLSGEDLGAGRGYTSPRSYVAGFAHLWDEINGRKVPWSSNPWTWVIGFRRSA